MASVSKSFTAVGVSGGLRVGDKESLTYSVSGTFVGTVILEKSADGGQAWGLVATITAITASTLFLHENKQGSAATFRFRCSAFTSGAIVTSMADVADSLVKYSNRAGVKVFGVDENGVNAAVRPSQTRIIPAAVFGKVGATSGWVVAAAADVPLATVPASKAASTLVIPLPGLKVGDTITGYSLIGQVGSVGGAVTVDADLRSQTASATGDTDADVGSITQVAVTANTIMSAANATSAALSQVVGINQTFYLLVTVTTAASTTVQLQGVAITVTEA